MENVGFAALQVIPSLRGFESKLNGTTSPILTRAGQLGGDKFGRAAGDRAARSFSSRFTTAVGIAGGFGLGAALLRVGKTSVELEAQFSQTMRQMAVASGAPQRQLDKMDKLAQKLGADTIFSANDAADAMLELAKNGLSPATIRAGALKQALTLAAAGGVGLADAADTMSNALNAFRLRGKDSQEVAAALAGAANASSANIGDIAQGLQQVGTVAHSAGLNIRETTALLAALSNAGIKGSDAGTSLKTMLINLVPNTKKAQKAADDLGLSFVKGNGQFKNAVEIAGTLQKAFSGLSQSQRAIAVQQIFGTDSQRAANILIDEGADGIRKYIKATSDQSQANKLAKASMQGTSGALEQLKGSFETAELQLGKGLAPTVQDVANSLSRAISRGDFEKWAREGADGARAFMREARPIADSFIPAAKTGFHDLAGFLKTVAPLAKKTIDAFNALPDFAQKAIVLGGTGAFIAKKTGVLSFGKNALTGTGGGGGPLAGILGQVKGTPANPVWVSVVGGGIGPGAPGGGGGGVGGVGGGGLAAKAAAAEEDARRAAQAAFEAAGGGAKGSIAASRAFKEAMAAHDAAVLKAIISPGSALSARGLLKTVLAAPASITLADMGNETTHKYDQARFPGVDFSKVGNEADFIASTVKKQSDAIDDYRARLGKASQGYDLLNQAGIRTFTSLEPKTKRYSDLLHGIPANVRTAVDLDTREARRRLAALRAEATRSLSIDLAGPHIGRPGDANLDGVRRGRP